MWKTWALGVLVTTGALAGCTCGSTPGGGDDGGSGASQDGGRPDGDGGTDAGADLGRLNRIELTPERATLTIDGTTPATQAFTVTGTFEDGTTKDLSAVATFSVDDLRLGSFNGGATFTSNTAQGGASTVRVRVGGMSDDSPLTLVMRQRLNDPNSPDLPPRPEELFTAQVVPARAPQLVYPNDGVMVPPNLGQLEFHFRKKASTNTLFELSFLNDTTDVRVYLRCRVPGGVRMADGVKDGCIYTPTPEVWSFVAATNRGAAPVQVLLKATGDAGGGVGVSESLSLRFARSELRGALYYWTTSEPTGVMRFDFANPASQSATPVVTVANVSAGVSCVGCHALSRNGKKLVAEVNGQDDGRLVLYDLATHTPANKQSFLQGGTRLGIFESWNPDGSEFVATYADTGATRFNLVRLDGNSGALLGEIAGTGTSTRPANHPDWSADGRTIAFTEVGVPQTNQKFGWGAIRMVQQDGSGWGAPVTVVPRAQGRNRYYPAISPDNAFLLYDESVCPSNAEADARNVACNADSDPSAKLWAAKLVQDAVRVELKRANQAGAMDRDANTLTNSFPKWSPFVGPGAEGPNSRLMWFTFASSRMYGLRKPVPASSEGISGTLVWMAAVDPDKVLAGEDGSFAAFALPFQDVNTSNHIAQWAEVFVSNGCSTTGEACGVGCCNGLQCVSPNEELPVPCDGPGGGCVCQPIPVCRNEGQSCSDAAGCCDGLHCERLQTDPPVPCSVDGACQCRPVFTCAEQGEACSDASPCCGGLTCQGGTCGRACGVGGQGCASNGDCCNGLSCLGPGGVACSGGTCACTAPIE